MARRIAYRIERARSCDAYHISDIAAAATLDREFGVTAVLREGQSPAPPEEAAAPGCK